MRIGMKLMVLVVLPIGALLGFVVLSAVADWRDRDRLRDFRTATRFSVATAELADDLALERLATVRARLQPGVASDARLATARAVTTAELQRLIERAGGASLPIDLAGRLEAARAQRGALLRSVRSLGGERIAAGYGVIVGDLLDAVRDLDDGRPTRATGRAADAYLAIVATVEAAARERVEVAQLLAPGAAGAALQTSGWDTLEAAELDVFRQTATGPLAVDVQAALFSPAGVAVQRLREELAQDPVAARRTTTLQEWLSISGTRIHDLRVIADGAAAGLRGAVARDVDRARTHALEKLALSLAVLVIVSALALALRRSITRPLAEVSTGARTLAGGDLTVDVAYDGRDELGDVAAAFRGLHATTGRLAGEIEAMNAAVTDNRLEHRADLGAFAGTWRQLLGGMNDTMAAFADLHGRREQAEREVERIFDLSLDMVAVADIRERVFTRVNPAFERTLGYPRAMLLDRPLLEFVHPDDRARTEAAFAALARGEELVQFENRLMRSDDTLRLLQWSARPAPKEGLAYAIARDVTDSRRAEAERRRIEDANRQLQYLAEHDSLTGLINSRRFREELDRELARARRSDVRGAVLLLDLDHFKHVNDTLGHAAGDALIAAAGELLARRLRETDVVARMGGDEFAVLLPDVSGRDASLVAAALSEAVRSELTVRFPGRSRAVTASIGIALFSSATESTAEEVLLEADIAMYEAKRAGGDRASVYRPTEDRRVRLEARRGWGDRIQRALEDDLLVLHAQPIVALNGDEAPRYELLVRMHDDDGGLLAPDAVLQIAERLDLVGRIDRWVVSQAARVLAAQQRVGHPIRLNVNLAPATIRDEELPAFVAGELDRYGADGRGLCFEIAENAAIINLDRARRCIAHLAAHGCEFALDQFGPGFASFSYLNQLPIDYLKIDGELIRDLPGSPTDQLVVKSIIEIAHGLGLRAIAKSVGDREGLELVRRYGADHAQGPELGASRPLTDLGLACEPQPSAEAGA